MTSTMRSPSLQKQHTAAYRDFYMQHDLVVSAPHTLRRSYSLARAAWPIGIQQPLPARMLCGVTFNEQRSVTIESITMYDPILWSFRQYEPSQVIKAAQREKIELTIRELLSTYGYVGWVTVNLLSEYRKGEGFWFMGSFFASLATIILLITNQVRVEQLHAPNFSTSPAYLLIQQLALYLDKSCLSHSWWASIAAAIASHGLPIAQISQPTIQGSPPSSSDKQSTPASRCFFGLQELYQTSLSVEELPIDYGVISFWLTHDCGSVKRAYQQSYRLLTDSYDRLMEVRQQRSQETVTPSLIGSSTSHPRDSYLYAHLLDYREQILSRPGDDGCVEWFIQSVMDCGLYHLMIEKDMHQFFQIYAWFDELKNFPNEKLWLMPISTTKPGWSILFVTRRGSSQETMEELLERLRPQHRHVHFSYLSWRDGFSSCGLHVEQYLSQDIYSSYVSPGSVVFVGGDGRCYVGSHQEILQSEQSGILLDQVYGKVYLEWQKTNHKQLRSQSWTTEILSILLKSIWKYVPHSVFPPSSYSTNKNEMIGKILSPFSTLMKSKFGISLPIECNGGVYDFEVKLSANPKGLLHLVSKVEEAGKEVMRRPI